jgi:hypothetical protein
MKADRLITILRGLRCTVSVYLDPDINLYTIIASRANAGTYSRYYTADRADALTHASTEVKLDNARAFKLKRSNHAQQH